MAVPKGNRAVPLDDDEPQAYVEIRGIDASSTTEFRLPWDITEPAPDLHLPESTGLYETQKRRATNLTYGGQIPYIPWHSRSVIAGIHWRSWQLNYSFIYVGERYHSSANIREDYEQPWYTHDMALINFKIKGYQPALGTGGQQPAGTRLRGSTELSHAQTQLQTVIHY